MSTGSIREPGARSRRGAEGFTLLELLVVLTLTGLMMGAVALTFNGYYQSTAARRAAQVFAQDLSLARSTAVRARAPVVIRFDESARWYSVLTQDSSLVVATRRFGANADIDLSAINLALAGDTLLFSSRGIADLSGATGSLGVATFTSGDAVYTVSFNSMGASRVE